MSTSVGDKHGRPVRLSHTYTRPLSATHRRLRPEVIARAGGRCECPGCGRCDGACPRTATTSDHVTPRALGGRDELANYRAACLPCNSSMGASLGNRLRSTHPFFHPEALPTPALSRIPLPVDPNGHGS